MTHTLFSLFLLQQKKTPLLRGALLPQDDKLLLFSLGVQWETSTIKEKEIDGDILRGSVKFKSVRKYMLLIMPTYPYR